MALADVAKLIVALTLDDKLSGPLGRVQSGLGRMAHGTGQVAGGLAKLGTVAGAVAVGGIAVAAKSAIDFEDAFAGIRKTVDETDLAAAGLTFEDLSDSIRKMAREMPIAATDLARIGEAAGALGIRAQDIDDFTKVVAELSVTTNLTSDQAATALGQLGTILHLTGGDFEDFADSLVALGNAGASTEDQIIDIASRFAAAGSAAGLSKEDILGYASAVASMGIDAEAAGSSLSRTFNNITTSIGTGAKEATAFADTMGLSAAEFRQRWDQDASGTFVEFLGVLGKMDQFKQAKILQDIGITGVRDVAAVQLMTQNLGFFNDQIAISRDASGALSVEAAKKFDTVASHIQILKNNLTDVGITIGNELLPIISDATKDFADFLNTPGAQQGIKDFARDLASGVSTLKSELEGTDFSGIIGGMKLAAEVAKGAFDAFRALPAPIQQLAIAALVANKVSGGAIGQIAKGLTNIALGGLKTITAANVTVIGKNVIGGGGGAAGPGGVVPTGGQLIGSLVKAGLFVGIATAIGELVAQNVTRPMDPTKFDFNQVAGASGEFTTQAKAETFAVDLAAELGVPLDEVKAGIVDAVNTQGLTFDQAVAQLKYINEHERDVVSEFRKSRATSDQLKALYARNTEQTRLTALRAGDIARYGQAALGPLNTVAAKDFSPVTNVNVQAVTNISVSNLSRVMTSYQVAAGVRLSDAGIY